VQVAATCSVRPIVFVPSDCVNLPSDGTLVSRLNQATGTIAGFYANKAGLTMRYGGAQVVRADRPSSWFYATDASGERYFDYGAVWAYLDRIGMGGICADGLISFVAFATTIPGEIAVGSLCGGPIRGTGNSGPSAGPGRTGFAVLGQWALDVILTGGDSATCQTELGAGHPKCRAATLWGAMMHEIGHGFGLQHPCEGWESSHWGLSSQQCSGLVMQNFFAYPSGGFDPREIEILALNPALRG
jgi:hypothetical protein